MTSPPVVTTRKKPRFPALLIALQTSPLLVPLLRANRSTSLTNNGVRVAGAQAGQFPSVLLTSLSLPTELTKKQKGSHWQGASLLPLPSILQGFPESLYLLHRDRGQAQTLLSPSPAGCIMQPVALQMGTRTGPAAGLGSLWKGESDSGVF